MSEEDAEFKGSGVVVGPRKLQYGIAASFSIKQAAFKASGWADT
jgi:hypothetical protein